ncbi:MAG: hypothetical protein WC102_06240 [Saccharofermentanales bacterium]
MSWFDKKKEKKYPCTCPVLEQIIEHEAAKCNMKVHTGFIPYPKPSTDSLPWRVEILEDRSTSIYSNVKALERDINAVRTQIEHEIMLGRPSKFTSLLTRVEVVEIRERELRTLMCRQKKRSDELEARIAELEKKNKDININIISKSKETEVELQKGE